jgi:hypothetical protein
MNDDDFLGQFAQYGGMTPMGPPPEKPKSALESVRMQKELERMRAEMAKLNPYPEVPRYEASISQRERDLATQMADMEKRRIATKRAEDTADMSLLDEIIAGGKAARLGTQAVVGGLTAPIAELFGVPADQYMQAAMSIPESKGELARAGQALDIAEKGLDYIIDTPVGQALGVVASLPMTPFNPATDRAVSAGLSGARAGVKLAGQGVKQAGQRVMEAGQNLSQAARAEFATPPTGAVQLQTQQAPRNPLGMYSQAEQVALNLPQQKGTGNQFLAQISKTPGVKPAELEWTGLADFLKSKGDQPVTKAEIQQHLDANRVQVEEVTLGRNPRPIEDHREIARDVAVLRSAGYERVNNPENPSMSSFIDKDGNIFSADDIANIFSESNSRVGNAAQRLQEFFEQQVVDAQRAATQYSQYQLPGGSNYREVLLTLPSKVDTSGYKVTGSGNQWYLRGPDNQIIEAFPSEAEAKSKIPNRAAVNQPELFKSPHFDQPNVLAHMRLNDRLDADGNRVLFVEEIQSDWGQLGKKEGFGERLKSGWRLSEQEPGFYLLFQDGYTTPKAHGNKETVMSAANRLDAVMKGAPSAPFVQNTEDWVNLSLKRLITDAVNNGYEKVAFINGEQSASRYDLSKQIDEVYYLPKTNTLVAKKGGEDKFRQNVPPDKLGDYIGKEAAEKLLAEPAKTFLPGSPMQRLSGVDLKVGGEGMKKFYDQIVPATANKLLKKLGGGKLEPIDFPAKSMMSQEGYALTAVPGQKTPKFQQLGFTITPEMVELVKNQGLPMFAAGGAVTMKTGGNPLKAMKQGLQAASKGVEKAEDAAKKASKAQRREERVQKNLEAYMGSKEKPKTYYHATQAPEDFEAFDLEKRPTKRSAAAVFVTPSTKWANDWAVDELADMDLLEKVDTPKPRIMPVITRAKNTFDYDDLGHVTQVMNQADLPPGLDRQHIADQISIGNWNFIEDRNIQKAIKDLGFDSFFVKEKGVKNMGIFDPGDVKALFNRGSYDPTTKDISKADGGRISADDIRQKLKNAFNFAHGGQAKRNAKEPKMAGGGMASTSLLERLRAYKKGGEVRLATGGSDLKDIKKNPLAGAVKGIKAAQKAVEAKAAAAPTPPAAPPAKREFTGSLAPATDPVRGQTAKELLKMQRSQLNDEQKEALEQFKQRYPEFAKASKFMTPQEVIKTISREDNVMQIDRLLKTIPSAKELSAVAKLGEPKRGWYRASTQAIMDVFGADAPRFASLLAAMSPQTSVESNLINTLNTWKNWTAAGRPTDERSIRRIMGSSVQGTKGEESVLDAWAANAARVLNAQDPLKVTLSGPKVDSFYRNLADDVYRVTNDAWMAGGLGVGQDLFSGSPTAVQLMRGDPGLTPGYIGTSARVREAGQMAEMLPSEAQETTWSVFMPLYEMQAKTGLPAREIIQRGLLTPDVIRGTPDFATLLKDPNYARILEQAGYGEQLSGLKPTPFSTREPSLSLSQQREVERAAARLEELREGRGRESRAKTFSLPSSGQPESTFAYSTYETIPGRGVGHLEGLIEEDLGKRKHFSSRAAAPFRDLQGRDVLQGSLGLKPIATRTMTGAYRPEGTIPGTTSPYPLETQPGFASGVEVPLTGGLRIPKRVQQELTAAEALRGLMTAQRGSPWNAQIPSESGEAMMAFPARKGRIDPEAMRYSASLMPDDNFMADTGEGVAVVPFGPKFSDEERKLIAGRLGASRFVPTTNVSDYVDYSQELTGPQGTGAATRKMFSMIDPLSGQKKSALSEAAQRPAGELYELYEQTGKSRNEPTREDLMNFLRILRDKGLPGLAAALASGQALPAEEEPKKAGGLAYLR